MVSLLQVFWMSSKKLFFLQPFSVKLTQETDADKKAMYERQKVKVDAGVNNLESVMNNQSKDEAAIQAAREVSRRQL